MLNFPTDKIKIAFEASSAIKVKPTGIARYIKSLVNSIAKNNNVHDLQLLYKASRLKNRENWYRHE